MDQGQVPDVRRRAGRVLQDEDGERSEGPARANDDRNQVAVRVEVSIPSGDWVLDTWRKRDERVLKRQPSRAVQQMHRWQLESELMLKRQEGNKLLHRLSKYEDDEGNQKEAAK
jgi:hypothetical protein